MKDKFETALLESGDLMKRGGAAIVGNIGRIIAAITVIVAALVLFTDVGFADFGTESFTSTLAVLLLASYLIYFSMADAGEQAGEESEEYRHALKKCTELSGRVGGEAIPALRDFCKSYAEEELNFRRESLLMSYGFSREEYEKYKSGKAASKKLRRAAKRADRLRAVSLTPKTLLSKERGKTKSELSNPEASRILYMLIKMLPTTLCMLLTVSVIFTAKENLTAGAVIDGIFKLSSLLVIGFKGYVSGYNYTRRTLPLWLDTKSRLLDAFLKLCN